MSLAGTLDDGAVLRAKSWVMFSKMLTILETGPTLQHYLSSQSGTQSCRYLEEPLSGYKEENMSRDVDTPKRQEDR